MNSRHLNAGVYLVVLCILFTIGACQSNRYVQGKRIYGTLCENCHGEKGQGLENLIPALSPANFENKNLDRTVCVIKNGVNANKLGVLLNVMPNHPKITPAELTNLINYIKNDIFGMMEETSLKDIEEKLKSCK